MAMAHAAPRDSRSHVDALHDPVVPHFELVTYPLSDRQDPIEDVNCQSGVMAVLRRSGWLEVRDAGEDRVLLRTLVRNPHKVFVHPQGTYVVATASDGEVSVQRTFDARMCATTQLQATDTLSGFVQGSREVVVGECVGWLPQDSYGAALKDSADALGAHTASVSTTQGSAMVSGAEWSCLMGVNKGRAIFALHVHARSSNSSRFKLRAEVAWSLPSPAMSLFPIRSIVFAKMGASGCVLLMSTATTLHEAHSRSISSPALLFHALSSGDVKLRTQTVPLYAGSASAPEVDGRVLVYRASCASAPQSYVWNSTAGVVHGLFRRDVSSDIVDENERLPFGASSSAEEEEEEGARVNQQSLSLARFADSPDATGSGADKGALPPSVAPIAVIPTAFHMIVVYPRRCLVLHQPPGASWRSPADSGGGAAGRFAPPLPAEVAQRIRFDPFRASPPPSSDLCGAIHDAEARRFFLFSRTHLWEVLIEDEAHQQWRLFLERGQDAQASLAVRKRYMDAACRLAFYSDTQRNLCLFHRGRFFLDCGATRHAITQFAMCDWFEDIYALLTAYRHTDLRTAFVEARFQFLLSHLVSLDDWAPQLTCLFVLLLLAKLDCVARSAAAPAAEADLHEFLLSTVERCGSFLKEKAVYELVVRLLEEQGYGESALLFAKTMQHTRYVVAYHVAQQQFDEAVKVLGTCHGSAARLLPWYEFTSVLMQHRPVALVTALLRALAKEARWGRVLPLQMERLIPSFMRYNISMNEVAGNVEHQVVVLLDQCIHRYGCPSGAVHNYYVRLLAQTRDAVRLDDFISSSLFFDTGYALRMCLEHRCTTAAVALYKHMHLYRDAVTTALYAPHERLTGSGASEDANVAKPLEDDDALPGIVAAEDTLRGLVGKVGKDELRHLWMLTAEQALASHNVAAALAVVQESGGILHTEDVLRRIDDVNLVDDFRDAICEYFDTYAQQKRQLSRTQDEVYQTAEGVKKDLRQAREQFGYITASQRCPLCHRTLLQSNTPYLVYPNCGHVVHEACAISRLESIGGLEAFLADEGIAPHVLDGVSDTRQLAQQDCVLCGEAVVVEVDIPLCRKDVAWDL
ncbi:hypothetical protein LSCM1_03436 [Leishmania martiniquensis]|uniref:Pep3/Vps18/deep orange domain-containing protein n=1 Tax=Leishmania martiniquensis TaxID=1580590 RepID=A0A836H576_9TRYP|nr:hypothetical protein LSCM1_03436 [Leishmania martiniquensis]